MSRSGSKWGLAIAAILWVGIVAPAGASSPLVGHGADVSELSHRIDIQLRGWIAEVTTKQTVIARRNTAEAIYTFKLPSDAAITDLTITLAGGQSNKAQLVDATAALEPAPHPDGARPDAGLLRLVEVDGELATYELRVYPIRAGRAVSWSIKWLVPVEARDGRQILRLPPRGAHPNLVSEDVRVSGSSPRGYDGFASVVGSGVPLGDRLPRRFRGGLQHGVVLELALRSSRTAKPVLEMASVPLSKTRSAVATTLAVPGGASISSFSPSRVLLVVDVSKSMEEMGRSTAAEVSKLILEKAGGADVDALLFHRTTGAVLGTWAANTPETRKKIVSAIASSPLHNGSDLAGALAAVEARVKDKPKGTLVVIISDALTPLQLTPAGAARILSKSTLEDARVAHITMLPRGTPAPLRSRVAASGLISAVGPRRGRLLTLRHLEFPSRRKTLWAELLAAPPLENIELAEQSKYLVEPSLKLPAGRSAWRVGLFASAKPRKVTASGMLGESEVTIKSQYHRRLESSVLPLLMARTHVLPPGFEDLDYSKLAFRAGVVTHTTSFWAPYPGDRFARERLALARRWGPAQFRRLPPDAAGSQNLRKFRFIAPRPLQSAPPPTSTPQRASGSLDRDIVKRLMRTYVVPKVHGCYRQALLPAKNIRGSFTIVVEMSRGEVTDARVEGSLRGSSTWAARVEACALDAAYSIRVPRVVGSDDVYLVRYPLSFKIVDSQGRVVEGRPSDVETEGPLDGLFR